jgi:hypothetical protein
MVVCVSVSLVDMRIVVGWFGLGLLEEAGGSAESKSGAVVVVMDGGSVMLLVRK